MSTMSELQEFLTSRVAKQNLEFATDRDLWKAEAERMTSGYDAAQAELAALREELTTAVDMIKQSRERNAKLRKRLTAAEQRNADSETKGIELAASWVDRRLANYCRDHGVQDPDTGTLEFPGDGAEYAEELDFIAISIRSLKTLKSGSI